MSLTFWLFIWTALAIYSDSQAKIHRVGQALHFSELWQFPSHKHGHMEERHQFCNMPEGEQFLMTWKVISHAKDCQSQYLYLLWARGEVMLARQCCEVDTPIIIREPERRRVSVFIFSCCTLLDPETWHGKQPGHRDTTLPTTVVACTIIRLFLKISVLYGCWIAKSDIFPSEQNWSTLRARGLHSKSEELGRLDRVAGVLQ